MRADAAIIGGLLIAASAIPAGLRGRREWLRAGSSAAIGERLEDRMEEMDHHYQEQIERLGRTRADQVADLEERLDFAERMLTKGPSANP